MSFINQSQFFPEISNYNDYHLNDTFPEINQTENDAFFMNNMQTFEEEKPEYIENESNLDEKYEGDNISFAKENCEKKSINEPKTNLANVQTKMTSNFINKKTKRNNDICDIPNEKTKSLENEYNYEKKKSAQGRKKKEEKDKGNHTKFSEDNIMRKIKSYFLTLSYNLLNESLNDKNMEFLKLDSFVNENLKKEYNEDLLNKTMKDLYYESKISSKYRKQAKMYADKNKLLIDKIYYDKEKLQTIKILDLTYRDLFNVFRKNILDINNDLKMKIKDIPLLESEQYNNIYLFFNEIYKQEKNKKEPKENIDIYIHNVKDLCMNYESWFKNKKGRNRISKSKNNNDN